MEVVAGIASVAGIIGLGIQIAQTLQKEIDTVRGADGRIQQIVIELHATATSLSNLQAFLEKDSQNSNAPILTGEARREVAWYTQRCDSVFRNLAVLLAKSGKAVLARVDAFQRDVQNRPKAQTQRLPDVTLKIELSSLEHLMWPWRWPKIEQSIADLDRIKLALLLVLNVANLGSKILRSVQDPDLSEYGGENSIDMLKDELYYRDQELAKAEMTTEKKQKIAKRVPSGIQGDTEIAKRVIDDWPNLPNGGGVASFSDVKDLGITLSGIALVDRGPERNYSHVAIKVNERTLYEEALKENKRNLESIRRLTVDQQTSIEEALYYFGRMGRRLMGNVEILALSQVLSVSICKNRRRRFLDILKSLTPLQAGIHGPARSSVCVVIASVEIAAEKKLTYRDDRYRRYRGLQEDIETSPARRPTRSEHAQTRARFSTADHRVDVRPQRSYERVRPRTNGSEWLEEMELRERGEKKRNEREIRKPPSPYSSDSDSYSISFMSSIDGGERAITRQQPSLASRRDKSKQVDRELGIQRYDHGTTYRRPTTAERDRIVNYYLRKWTTVFRYVRDIYHRATTDASPHTTDIVSRTEDAVSDENMAGAVVIANGSESRFQP